MSRPKPLLIHVRKMPLVDYSDSEGSDLESRSKSASAPVVASRSKPNPTKPAFQKVLDRSDAGKIRVSLPPPTTSAGDGDGLGSDVPPAKKVKTAGGGLFSDFNSVLPPPTRTGQIKPTAALDGMRSMHLKTGAQPAFSREPAADEAEHRHGDSNGRIALAGEEPSQQPHAGNEQYNVKDGEDKEPVMKKPMFKPLSVARNAKKRKAPPAAAAKSADDTARRGERAPAQSKQSVGSESTQPKAPKPRSSLFSFDHDESVPRSSAPRGKGYQFMMQEPGPTGMHEDSSLPVEVQDSTGLDTTPTNTSTAQSNNSLPPTFSTTTTTTTNAAQSLTSIAADLDLSPSELRQLLGRRRGREAQELSASKVVNFNTDEEYRANEELRARGETVSHNPVRSIAPGKHSLQQLVNNARMQQDALEESFATGKGNRKEAGGRYGWG